MGMVAASAQLQEWSVLGSFYKNKQKQNNFEQKLYLIKKVVFMRFVCLFRSVWGQGLKTMRIFIEHYVYSEQKNSIL